MQFAFYGLFHTLILPSINSLSAPGLTAYGVLPGLFLLSKSPVVLAFSLFSLIFGSVTNCNWSGLFTLRSLLESYRGRTIISLFPGVRRQTGPELFSVSDEK